MSQNNENFEICEHSDEISIKDFEDFFYLIKEENPHAILSKLGKESIRNYLNIVVNSKKLFLISCKINNPYNSTEVNPQTLKTMHY